ncbi:hypothetical protein EU245_02885 [Lentibacillus lipolyticus]|nr:hypothetical protein EU245_02885 [Lentibacillus lipolyticus]
MRKAKQDVILPIKDEEIAAIRTYQQRTVKLPTYTEQKAGIIMYSLTLLFVIAMFFIGIVSTEFQLSFYPLIFIPLLHTQNFLDLFAVMDDGILCGTRFVAWERIKSFEFVRIDINHKYYGFSKEVNDTYELRIKAKFHSISCIVTTDEVKEKLNNVLNEHVR